MSDGVYWNIKINRKWALNAAIVLIVSGFIAAIALTPSERKTNRMIFSEFLVSIAPAKFAVTEFIESKPAGTPVTLEASSFLNIGPYGNMKSEEGYQVYIESFNIDAKGKITLLASGLPVSVELTPIINGNKIEKWQCAGRPEILMKGICY